jgi:uncharacterized protein
MSLKIEGAHEIAASPEETWRAVNDVEILRQCIPGCEALEQISPTEFAGVILFKIGPVKARFKGRVTLKDLEPPHRCNIVGAGEGGIAGFAKGQASVRLDPTGSGTRISYSIDASIGGKIAQLGSRLMAGTVTKLAGQFFDVFATKVSAA